MYSLLESIMDLRSQARAIVGGLYLRQTIPLPSIVVGCLYIRVEMNVDVITFPSALAAFLTLDSNYHNIFSKFFSVQNCLLSN